MKTISIDYALLAMQSALLGVVTPELRAVVVDVNPHESWLYIRFYYHGSISEEVEELWQCAMTEASASLGTRCFVDEAVERLDYPNEIPMRGRLAYLRKEK